MSASMTATIHLPLAVPCSFHDVQQVYTTSQADRYRLISERAQAAMQPGLFMTHAQASLLLLKVNAEQDVTRKDTALGQIASARNVGVCYCGSATRGHWYVRSLASERVCQARNKARLCSATASTPARSVRSLSHDIIMCTYAYRPRTQ